jgi:hypothetical protein
MVEQARGNNKGISFSEDFVGSAIEWYALFSGRTCPCVCTGIENRLLHKINLPPSQMNIEAMPDSADSQHRGFPVAPQLDNYGVDCIILPS